MAIISSATDKTLSFISVSLLPFIVESATEYKTLAKIQLSPLESALHSPLAILSLPSSKKYCLTLTLLLPSDKLLPIEVLYIASRITDDSPHQLIPFLSGSSEH